MRYYLGLDGGGTKTAAQIIDESYSDLGAGEGGAGNLVANHDGKLRRSVRDAVQSALENAGLPHDTVFSGVCAGMAGYSATQRVVDFTAILQNEVAADTYLVEPDYTIAYWGATLGQPGIVVIAGTGAVTYGRNANGETRKEDGLGFLLGDRGSGFNLGVRVLRYTLEQMQSNTMDELTYAVLKHTGAQSQNEIIHWLYSEFSPPRVASLSPVVGALAEQGDGAARRQVAEMARCLRHSVRQVRHTLLMARDAPVYALGGLWQLGEFFRAEFAEPRWSGEGRFAMPPEAVPGGRFNLAEPAADPVHGAAAMALHAASEASESL